MTALQAQAHTLAPTLRFMASTVPNGSKYHILGGSNTYDDFWELPIDSYM